VDRPQSWCGWRGEVKFLAPTGTGKPSLQSSSPYPVAIPTALQWPSAAWSYIEADKRYLLLTLTLNTSANSAVHETDKLNAICCWLWRQYGILNISQSHRTRQTVTAICLFFLYYSVTIAIINTNIERKILAVALFNTLDDKFPEITQEPTGNISRAIWASCLGVRRYNWKQKW
jgi:hypothetical protein